MSATRFLVLSDTHDEWPYTDDSCPAPKVDVLLRCGDLTQVGGLPSFRRAIECINSIDAELKLVIAGNHDLELDPKWWVENQMDDDDPEDSARALQLFKSQKASGLHYLEEGIHSFELKNGARFTVYASPYTPEFNGYAFPYSPEQDRFTRNSGAWWPPEPIPSRNVDIIMTHGPPAFNSPGYQLDFNGKSEHCGCDKLSKALRRCKPLLHCFGHLHEGRGAAYISWQGDAEVPHVDPIGDSNMREILEVKPTGSTLLVNAAMHGEARKGFLVDIDFRKP
ncbi:Ser/Thr protein phosphatase family protein [Lophiotrema nucula]|uniref:Ser/Thr protein phosphatase family protein n=1 Tax=Lophiotrema nucula TaxID=690887 RepID=A0A6A5Z377_9PLEO|nr:Ser/Thr protein phosphatase family protein [Lophiotrema nucula]